MSSMTSLITAVWAVAVLWAVVAVQICSLAVRRGRMTVRRSASRTRVVLLVAAVAGAFAALAGGFVSAPRALVAAPLLVVPAAVALVWTLPPLRALVSALGDDPWGPSDPRTRRAASEPRLTVPSLVAPAGAVAAVLVLTGGLVTALVAYGLTGAVTAALLWWAPRRHENAAHAGVLRRTLIRAERLTAGPLAGRPATAKQATGREAA
ncbi:hypothetical protein [Actinoallomurus acaciae]|uniref:Uncharacterized protein n=1 Tax=Actinoallomurus acaciae TaxID=502577 RepID=A0ABV5YIV9_9ACTN